MISPSELRIGNAVIVKGVVTNILNNVIINHIMGDEDYYEGVPLTEEILLKCGFTTGDGILRRLDGTICKYEWEYQRLFLNNKNKWEIALNCDNYGNIAEGIQLNYLHQLQNIIYCITGKEIKVNLC